VDKFKAVVLVMLVAGCAGEVEGSGSEPEFDGTCHVPYDDIVCEFVCTDCADPETGEYRDGSCENALPTALDYCSFQKHHPNGYAPDE
jgi:hypothetical protein